MRWVSTSGEFAFLSVGGTARGIIAIGWVAHGVVAVGGALSVGVISIGMNAVGSVVALGMNAAAPISLSLINGIGIYTLAGVNGLGAWTQAGTNASGMSSEGGVNSDISMAPAIVFIAIALILTLVFPGQREPRAPDTRMPLRRFARSPDVDEAEVRAELTAVRDDDVELTDGRTQMVVETSEGALEKARAIVSGSGASPHHVTVHLARTREAVRAEGEGGYRDRPPETVVPIVLCTTLDLAPAPESRLPKDIQEVQWLVAWTGRAAIAVAVVLLVFL